MCVRVCACVREWVSEHAVNTFFQGKCVCRKNKFKEIFSIKQLCFNQHPPPNFTWAFSVRNRWRWRGRRGRDVCQTERELREDKRGVRMSWWAVQNRDERGGTTQEKIESACIWPHPVCKGSVPICINLPTILSLKVLLLPVLGPVLGSRYSIYIFKLIFTVMPVICYMTAHVTQVQPPGLDM